MELEQKLFSKKHPLRCKLIDIWRGVDRFQPTIVGTNGMRGMIIGEIQKEYWGRLS